MPSDRGPVAVSVLDRGGLLRCGHIQVDHPPPAAPTARVAALLPESGLTQSGRQDSNLQPLTPRQFSVSIYQRPVSLSPAPAVHSSTQRCSPS